MTTRPTLVRNTRRPNADELVRVLPPGLHKLIEAEPEAAEHQTVAERYGEARTKLAALTSAHEQALTADEVERRKALRTGAKAKAQKAEKIAAELEETRRDLDSLGAMLAETSQALLVASLPHVREAIEQAKATRERSLDEAGEFLAAAIASFEASSSGTARRRSSPTPTRTS
jgi:hypothetical protein